MKTDLQNLSPDSRVWIYQSGVSFDKKLICEMQEKLDRFITTWAAHGKPLMAAGKILHDRFIVLIVDEKYNGISGCSIDSSVAFIKELEEQYKLHLFDRFSFSYFKGDQVETVSKDEFKNRYRDGIIDDETSVFDNLVDTKREFSEAWIKPLKDSWHKRFV